MTHDTLANELSIIKQSASTFHYWSLTITGIHPRNLNCVSERVRCMIRKSWRRDHGTI